ncbi:DedA family protein [Rhodococcoides fascians]|uniref:DedA family protein n=1 Tax=Rhodococcoides fascians TaxID=1828 RepID=UPI00325B417F
MAGLGIVPTPVAYVVAVSAAVAGPSIGWSIGRGSGPAMRSSALGKRIPQSTWKTAERVIDSRGPCAVVIAQFVVGARTMVPLLIGMSPGRYFSFAVVSIPTAAVWAGALTTAGHLVGASYQILTAALGNGTVAVAIVAIVTVALGWVGRFFARQSEWAVRWSSVHRTTAHTAFDQTSKGRMGEHRATRVMGVLWWLSAVLAGTVSSAAVVWAVQRSELESLDRPVAVWIDDHAPEMITDAADAIAAILNAPNVLLTAYLLTFVFVFVVRQRSGANRARRMQAVTVFLGLAALAVSSGWITSRLRVNSWEVDSAIRYVDLQSAVVPCAFAIAVVLVSPWLSYQLRVVAWISAVLFVGLSAAAQLVVDAMSASEIAASTIIGAAWTVLMANLVRPPSSVELGKTPRGGSFTEVGETSTGPC